MQIKSSLTIVPFDLTKFLSSDWNIDPDIYGSTEGNGVDDFFKVLSDVGNILRDEFFNQFIIQLEGDEWSLTGLERLNSYRRMRLGDPDLGWSLFFEPCCKTLHLLNSRFGIDWLEFPRLTFSRINIKESHSLCLYCISDQRGGRWYSGTHPLRVPLQATWYKECTVGFSE